MQSGSHLYLPPVAVQCSEPESNQRHADFQAWWSSVSFSVAETIADPSLLISSLFFRKARWGNSYILAVKWEPVDENSRCSSTIFSYILATSATWFQSRLRREQEQERIAKKKGFASACTELYFSADLMRDLTVKYPQRRYG